MLHKLNVVDHILVEERISYQVKTSLFIMTRSLLNLLLLSMAAVASSAFQLSPVVAPSGISRATTTVATSAAKRTQVIMHSSKDNKKKGPFDEGLRTKLVSESIAPWRSLRLFLYGSAASGAAVGGFITLTGTLAAISGARTDVDLNVEVRN